MVAKFCYHLILRFVMPSLLIFAVLIRPGCISLFYLFMFFVTPFLSTKTSPKSYHRVSIFTVLLVIYSGIILIGHLLLQFIELIYVDILRSISDKIVLQHIGFVSFKKQTLMNILQWIIADVVIFIASLGGFVVLRYLRPNMSIHLYDSDNIYNHTIVNHQQINRVLIIYYIKQFLCTTTTFALFTLYFTAILRPSLPGILYFLVFIICGNSWAWNNSIHRNATLHLILIAIVIVVHLTCLLAYQLPIIQNQLNVDNIWARLFGLEALIVFIRENDIQKLSFNSQLNADSFLSPIMLMITYFICVVNIKNRKKIWLPISQYRASIYHGQEDIKLDTMTPQSVSIIEQIFYVFYDLSMFLYRNSYLLTNIGMMAWSIIYHSWLTFVLLLWANVVWMIPNQRKTMMHSSVFVVFYAEFLLLAQYIYSMNFKQGELMTSTNSTAINWAQIGFVRPQDTNQQPCVPLAVKTCFLIIFWITSRQYFKEYFNNSANDLLVEIFGATQRRSQLEHMIFENEKTPSILIYLSELITNFVSRIWMWLLIAMLFLCSMLEFHQTMNGFRICYMALFLIFLMAFQFSTHIWIRFMYGFWLFLILFAMTILTLIYTYQFDMIDKFYKEILKFDYKLQSDIGLRRYQTRDLFLQLFVPTLIIILTVIQMQYFHKKFISSIIVPQPLFYRHSAINISAQLFGTQQQMDVKESTLVSLFRITVKKVRTKIKRSFRASKNVVWRYMELHSLKFVYFAAFNSAVSKICFFHVPIVVLCVMALMLSQVIKKIVIHIFMFLTVLNIIMVMMYQVTYINNDKFLVNCSNTNIYNTAKWLGLSKVSDTDGVLMNQIAPYILFIVIASLHAIIRLRQQLFRHALGLHTINRPNLLYSRVCRADTEKDLASLTKFLLNYGFYKFGLEITLIAFVANIVYRQDILAIIYTIWLIVLLTLPRLRIARIWPFFELFMAISIIMQYVFDLNFPPGVCLSSSQMLPCSNGKNNLGVFQNLHAFVKEKLKYDYIVFIFIICQKKAFQNELHNEITHKYPGGDNRSAVRDIAKLGHVYFENPTHDFSSYVRNYADILKTVLFCNLFWVTLCLVFLAGICSTDLLSLVYLIFALFFLIKGSEFYLQNIHSIIYRWQCLIAFNVINIIIKTIFHALSCYINKKSTPIAYFLYNYVLGTGVEVKNESYLLHYNYDSLIFKNIMIWHAIVFGFVIFQLRLFRSYYFCHLIMETNANNILACRGAAIIENLRHKQILDRREHEKMLLVKIKNKMERIRAANQNFTQRTQKRRDVKLHPYAVRSGDYYMFEELDERPDLRELFDDDRDSVEVENKAIHHHKQKVISFKESKISVGGFDEDEISNDQKLYVNVLSSSSSEDEFDINPIITLAVEFIVSLTARLNRFSHNYRYVHKILSEEKKILQDVATLNRLGMTNSLAMFQFLHHILKRKSTSGHEYSRFKIAQEYEFTAREHNVIVKCLISLVYAIYANTEIICYIAVFINQAANSSLVSLPMPLAVLFWGSLTLPRPSKTFWVSLIFYALTMVFIKCIITQNIFLIEYSMEEITRVKFELIIKPGNTVYDLLLIIVLFWHRYMLKKQGIWTEQPAAAMQRLAAIYEDLDQHLEERPNIIRQNPSKSNDKNETESTSSSQIQADQEDIETTGKNNIVDDGDEFFAITSNDDEQISENEREEAYRKYEEMVETKYYLDGMAKLSQNKCSGPLFKFFFTLLYKARLSTDVYAYLFACGFINFFVMLFDHHSFVSRNKINPIHSYIVANKVPLSFLIMLFLQFVTIVIERAIYLRKSLKNKIILHFITVIIIHIWMFFAIPYMTGRSFGEKFSPVLFYIISCIHMLLSAYQIRCGYPTHTQRNFFTKNFSLVNLIAFKVYMEIPFLFVLRTILDWVCLDTTLTLLEWMKLEDIYQHIFTVRCYRQMDSDFPVARSEPKLMTTKLLLGGSILCLLMLLIWSPLCIFALDSAFGEPNLPNNAEVILTFEPYGPIYSSKTYSNIFKFSGDQYHTMKEILRRNTILYELLSLYEAADLVAVRLKRNSATMWHISPPDKRELLHSLKQNATLIVRITYIVSHPEGVVKMEHMTNLHKGFEDRYKLINMIENPTENSEKVFIPNILPKLVLVKNQGKAMLIGLRKSDGSMDHRPVYIKIQKEQDDVWWEIYSSCDDDYFLNTLSLLPYHDCQDGITIYIISDKKFRRFLSYVIKTGIIGLYTTFIYFISRFLRTLIGNTHQRIMFTDLPYVDRVLKLCLDIYLVRELLEFKLEEDLYAKLLFLFRSPETLIRWTRWIDEDHLPTIEYKQDNVSQRATQSRDRQNEKDPSSPPTLPSTSSSSPTE